jgi:hypothetical protein
MIGTFSYRCRPNNKHHSFIRPPRLLHAIAGLSLCRGRIIMRPPLLGEQRMQAWKGPDGGGGAPRRFVFLMNAVYSHQSRLHSDITRVKFALFGVDRPCSSIAVRNHSALIRSYDGTAPEMDLQRFPSCGGQIGTGGD